MEPRLDVTGARRGFMTVPRIHCFSKVKRARLGLPAVTLGRVTASTLWVPGGGYMQAIAGGAWTVFVSIRSVGGATLRPHPLTRLRPQRGSSSHARGHAVGVGGGRLAGGPNLAALEHSHDRVGFHRLEHAAV